MTCLSLIGAKIVNKKSNARLVIRHSFVKNMLTEHGRRESLKKNKMNKPWKGKKVRNPTNDEWSILKTEECQVYAIVFNKTKNRFVLVEGTIISIPFPNEVIFKALDNTVIYVDKSNLFIEDNDE